MRRLRSILLGLFVSSTALAQPTVAPAPAPPPPAPVAATTPSPAEETMKKELEELRKKQLELEHRLDQTRKELQKPPAAPIAPASIAPESTRPPPPPPSTGIPAAPPDSEALVPRFRFGRGGFVFSTPDGKTSVRLRAVLNVDGHAYVGGTTPDTFFIRRARPFIDGTLWDVIDFRIMPDFAQGTAQLLDGYVDLRPFPWLRLRAGRFMIPVGLEWMQKDTTTSFVERSLVTDLVPWRDIGLMLSGDVGDGTFLYQLAIVNGAPDGGNGPDLDTQTAKDYVGRLFLRPLRRMRCAAFTDLGFGIAGSFGTIKGTATANGLASYKTPGQQPMFSYLVPSAKVLASTSANTEAVIADGNRWRVTPQLYWYVGPFGLLTEYIYSSQRVSKGIAAADIGNRAWNVTASFALTMERATFDGLTPRHPMDFRHKAFGAFELVARYSELRFDASAFPTFADPTLSVRSARELAAGLNWYVPDYVKIMFSYHHTSFEGGAGMGAGGVVGDRPDENALMGRLQLAL
jgi:phosphate-selective porin OprO and OprP